jgi:hypothetical protein
MQHRSLRPVDSEDYYSENISENINERKIADTHTLFSIPVFFC